MSAKRRRRSSTSTPRSSTCAPCRRSTSIRSVLLSKRPAAAWSRTKPRGFPASARNSRRAFRKSASGISRRRFNASPAGTRHTRTPSNGSIFPGRRAWRSRCAPPWARNEAGKRGTIMSRYVFKMPDLGEGTVSAEVVAWHVKPGDLVQEDQVMCEVMTEKAAVEMPAPVTGRILSIQGEPGDMVAVGSELVVFDTDATSAAAGDAPAAKTPPPAPAEPLTPHRRATDKQAGEKQGNAAAAAAN